MPLPTITPTLVQSVPVLPPDHIYTICSCPLLFFSFYPASSTPLLRRPFVLRFAHASRASFQYNYQHAARASALRALLLLIPIPLPPPLFLPCITKIQRWPRTLGLYQNSSVLSSSVRLNVCLFVTFAPIIISMVPAVRTSLPASTSRLTRRICISGISHVCTPSGLIRVVFDPRRRPQYV